MASITLKPNVSTLGVISKARQRDRPAGPLPSLKGQTVVLTGGSSGFGLATAHILPTLGVTRLILGVRSTERGEAAAKPMRIANPTCKIEVWELDMLSYESVQAFAHRCAELPRLDLVILNAGVTKLVFARSPSTGHEETIQVNYLSTALLAILLVPILKTKSPANSPGRLTIVGSSQGYSSKFKERSANSLLEEFDKEWSGIPAGSERYSTSKTLVQMLVYKLSQLIPASDVTINNFCPGFSAHTSLGREVPKGAARILMGMMQAALGRTAEQGAWTYIDAAAIKGEESHGSFVFGWEMFPFHPLMYTKEGEEVMERLWSETVADQEAFGIRQALEAIKQ
ncbi:short-chain dehydrogenase [Karstenula rhodostoma CBS 690.94]|uniref:Short-chain dehydrogenase n=1 Tax=Karstenula rhodostoma CBS 690.94 TaxID=1392251 RepID=A0A9P4PFB1_9PLEO|nr:short-chain dehydrogenase [Karstenula rhodostoma CBS 690.94]